MKLTEYLWDHSELKRYLKHYPVGGYLFQMGEKGTTMFILVQGIVHLMAKVHGTLFPLKKVSAGEFLGEKALLGDPNNIRFFSAMAKSEVTAFEVGLKEIPVIDQKAPGLMTAILKQMFQSATRRLDEANAIIASLRSSDNTERIPELIATLSRLTGRKPAQGSEFLLSPHCLRFYADMNLFYVEESLKALEKAKLLFHESDDYYRVPNESQLREAGPKVLKEWVPNLMKI
jgi:CRP-like cAMP-binding protein